jgi:hypothetical protein
MKCIPGDPLENAGDSGRKEEKSHTFKDVYEQRK